MFILKAGIDAREGEEELELNQNWSQIRIGFDSLSQLCKFLFRRLTVGSIIETIAWVRCANFNF